jgi:hypothetical protein
MYVSCMSDVRRQYVGSTNSGMLDTGDDVGVSGTSRYIIMVSRDCTLGWRVRHDGFMSVGIRTCHS